MKTAFDHSGFNEQPIKCSNCNWQGTGAESIVIDFYIVTGKGEVHCPERNEPLGLVRQHNNTTEEDSSGTSA